MPLPDLLGWLRTIDCFSLGTSETFNDDIIPHESLFQLDLRVTVKISEEATMKAATSGNNK